MRVLLALMLFSCASAGEVTLDTPFTVRYGQTVTVRPSGLQITFTDVNDSRCPRNVNCVWEGEAVVALNVTEGARTEQVSIKLPGTATGFGHRIELREVNPYPEDDAAAKEKYSVELVVGRN